MKKKLGIVGAVLAIASFGIIGWRIGLEIAMFDKVTLDIWKVVLFVVGFVLAFYIHIILHEFGHLVGGLVGGYTFMSFCIGRLCLSKETGKLKLSFEKNKNIGGYCKMLPPKNVTKESFVSHIMGGLISSLMLTAVSLVLFLLLFFVDDRGYLFWAFAGAFPINAYIFFTNAAVVSIGGTATDGMLVDMMKKNADSSVATMKILTLQGYFTSGVSPREIPESLVSDIPVIRDDDVMSAVIYSNLFYYYLDRADEKKIFYYGKKIEDILPYASDIYMTDLETSAFLTSIFEDNEEKASKYYAKLLGKAEKADDTLLLAFAYYEKLFLFKDISDRLEKTRLAAKNDPLVCTGKTVLMYAKWLEEL